MWILICYSGYCWCLFFVFIFYRYVQNTCSCCGKQNSSSLTGGNSLFKFVVGNAFEILIIVGHWDFNFVTVCFKISGFLWLGISIIEVCQIQCWLHIIRMGNVGKKALYCAATFFDTFKSRYFLIIESGLLVYFS